MAQLTVLDRQPASPPVARASSTGEHRCRTAADRAASRDVLRQLDAWCRSHDAPSVLNAWIAEEALRRA
ncbi:MAG TPA: hypothetical protein VLT32_07055 [Candidatus Sulfomarinibacteraceae bacterium]|nr:hypothetical protein [Candidatus Sulfomarinibacteraceae bacterium]